MVIYIYKKSSYNLSVVLGLALELLNAHKKKNFLNLSVVLGLALEVLNAH